MRLRPSSPSSPAPGAAKSRKRWPLALAAALAIGAGGLGVWYWKEFDPFHQSTPTQPTSPPAAGSRGAGSETPEKGPDSIPGKTTAPAATETAVPPTVATPAPGPDQVERDLIPAPEPQVPPDTQAGQETALTPGVAAAQQIGNGTEQKAPPAPLESAPAARNDEGRSEEGGPAVVTVPETPAAPPPVEPQPTVTEPASPTAGLEPASPPPVAKPARSLMDFYDGLQQPASPPPPSVDVKPRATEPAPGPNAGPSPRPTREPKTRNRRTEPPKQEAAPRPPKHSERRTAPPSNPTPRPNAGSVKPPPPAPRPSPPPVVRPPSVVRPPPAPAPAPTPTPHSNKPNIHTF